MPAPFSSFSVRVLVLFHGAVALDRLLPAGPAVMDLGDDDRGLCVPVPEGAERAPQVRWVRDASFRVWVGDQRIPLTPDQPWGFTQGPVEVRLEVVRHFRVTPRTLGMDPIFATALGSMVALALGVQTLLAMVGPPPGAVAVEATPELIARLLQEETEGAEVGLPALTERPRPQTGVQIQDIYLPAGDRGPLDRPGGSEHVGQERRVSEAQQARAHQPLRTSPRPVQAPDAPPRPDLSGPDAPQELAFAEDPTGEAPKTESASAETQLGFGLKDWFETTDARDRQQIEENLRFAEALVELEPNSLWALQNLAYYQYLNEDFEGCRRTYDRFIALAPDEAAGYNNLALVFKRRGEFAKEEGYYRQALALEPDDTHALSNLALNLAHQGRYAEAWATMERVAALEPGDPYADLHRAKLMAAQDRNDEALRYLELALQGVGKLDTFHHIEFRQDIRVDPAFADLRDDSRFQALLLRYYGESAQGLTPGVQDG